MCSSTTLTRGSPESLYFQHGLFGQEKSSPLTTRCKVSVIDSADLNFICRFELHFQLSCNGIVWVFLKWGFMRYLFTISVLPTVDDCQHTPSLQKQQEYWCRTLSNKYTAVDQGSNKTYFSHPPKNSISVQVYTIFRIFFTNLPFHQTAPSDGEVKLLYPSMLSPKAPDRNVYLAEYGTCS